jgi:hypothetical protein
MKLIQSLLPCIETPADPDAAYLGQAVDIPDLERRMREVDARR